MQAKEAESRSMAASAIPRLLTDQSDRNFCFGCCDFKKAQDSELLRGYSAYDPVADALAWLTTGSTLKNIRPAVSLHCTVFRQQQEPDHRRPSQLGHRQPVGLCIPC